MNISEATKKQFLVFQRNELYRELAKVTKDSANRDVLNRIADDELRHYEQLKQVTGQDVSRDRLKIWRVFFASGN